MKLKLNKSLKRDRKIIKMIKDVYPHIIKKKFIFNVKITKKYLDMIRNKYISTLIPFSKKELTKGIKKFIQDIKYIEI